MRPNRLERLRREAGDTWQGIAQRAGIGLVSGDALALMNGFAVNVLPRGGDTR